MPVWPKSFYTFGVSLKTAATEWKLRQKRNAPQQQARALATLTKHLARTVHWKARGIEPGMAYEVFRARVPLHAYRDLAPAIEQMKRGATDVLWPGRCALFAQSSGTTTGERKFLPVTEEMLVHLRRAILDALLYYNVRVKHAGVFRGRHLIVGGPTELVPIGDAKSQRAYTGELSGILAAALPTWAEKHVYEPGATGARTTDWDTHLEATLQRTSTRDISLIAGMPNWMTQLATALHERCVDGKKRISSLQGVWPNLECFVHTGVPVTPFAARLRALLGSVNFHEVYAAAEGFIATQDATAAQGLRLMTDLGIFFEFLPLADFDETRLAELGAKAVPVSNVKPEIDYVIVVTTPGGLVRYVLGDVVRFTSVEPPRLVYVGSTQLRLNAFGENVTEKEVTEALTAVCQRHDWLVVNFHVSALLGAVSFGRQNRGRHEWWIELLPGTIATPTGPQIAAGVDAEIQRMNPEYAARRQSGAIEPPTARLVMPGVFEHWLRFQKKWGGQHKIARCRSDRSIADQLAQVTHFATD